MSEGPHAISLMEKANKFVLAVGASPCLRNQSEAARRNRRGRMLSRFKCARWQQLPALMEREECDGCKRSDLLQPVSAKLRWKLNPGLAAPPPSSGLLFFSFSPPHPDPISWCSSSRMRTSSSERRADQKTRGAQTQTDCSQVEGLL